MSVDNVVLGPVSRVKINGVLFAHVSGSIDLTADTPDATDSESAPFKMPKGGLRSLEAQIEAHGATDVSPHAMPLDIQEGDLIEAEFFPWGLASDSYHCHAFRVARWSINWGVAGSNPVQCRLSGSSYDEFDKPSTLLADGTFPT